MGFFKEEVKSFIYESATARIRIFQPNQGVVTNVHAGHKRQGHGSKVMQLITEYADANQLNLVLIVQGYGRAETMSNKELEAFYAKFGFAKVLDNKKPVTMKRMYSR
ncbi:MAG: hypothetical protein BWY50_01869 [Spirochaetes bacterium ADurb.Bin315]|nr:MAG: hypothetical protein BWY50_01869 [Spirochaetes bacterium ADurb.Bin315]